MPITSISDLVSAMKSALEASALSPITHCDICGENDSCGAKLDAVIVSAKFDGMPLLQRQKAVHEAVSKPGPEHAHAFIMKFLHTCAAEGRVAARSRLLDENMDTSAVCGEKIRF